MPFNVFAVQRKMIQSGPANAQDGFKQLDKKIPKGVNTVEIGDLRLERLPEDWDGDVVIEVARRSDNNGKFTPLFRFARDTSLLRWIGIDDTYKVEYNDWTGYAGTWWQNLAVSAVMNENNGYSLADYATLFGAPVITDTEWYQ